MVNYLSVNQSGVQINAGNIDLTGITTIYNPNGSYTIMSGQGMIIKAWSGQVFYNYPIEWDTYVSFKLGQGIGTYFPSYVNFKDVGFSPNSTISFTNATVTGLTAKFG